MNSIQQKSNTLHIFKKCKRRFILLINLNNVCVQYSTVEHERRVWMSWFLENKKIVFRQKTECLRQDRLWLNRIHRWQNRKSRLIEKKVQQIIYNRKQLKLKCKWNLNEIETNCSNFETAFQREFNWYCKMSRCWSKILQKWTHQFEDVINTQTHQAIKKEDDERWEKVFEQTSTSFKDELWLFEVM